MKTVESSVEVGQDVRTVYNQWTQFESFPEFMEGVSRVEQRSNDTLHWVADIGMVEREFDARIVEQVPDRVIAWRADGQVRHDGRVTFEAIEPGRTKVTLAVAYAPEGLVEKSSDALGLIDRRVEGDLDRFKEFIEARGRETGAWRGGIRDAP